MTKQHISEYIPTSAELQQELHATAQELRGAYARFNYVSAPELIEASIYEIESLKARYNYLLRCIKELGGAPVRSPMTIPSDASKSVAASAMKGGKICHL